MWVSKEDYESFLSFLDKFSAGKTFPEQARNFIHWLATQTEGIDQRLLDAKLAEIDKERIAKQWHCLRGVMKDWQLQRADLREAFCSVCKQRHTDEFQECQRRRKTIRQRGASASSLSNKVESSVRSHRWVWQFGIRLYAPPPLRLILFIKSLKLQRFQGHPGFLSSYHCALKQLLSPHEPI